MPRKKAEVKEEIKEAKPKKAKEVKPKMVQKLEVTYIYHEGDNLPEITKALTGHEYLMETLLRANGLTLNTLKEGDILRWNYGSKRAYTNNQHLWISNMCLLRFILAKQQPAENAQRNSSNNAENG